MRGAGAAGRRQVAGGGDGTPTLVIRLFGAFEVQLHDAPLPRLASRKSEWLLALLALRAGQAVERGWLRGLLWPESEERAAQKNLRNSLTELRRVLGPAAWRLRSLTARTLCLDLTALEVDVREFDRAIAQGGRAALERAVSLYRGPLLEGRALAEAGWAEWAFEERQVHEQSYLAALETLAEQALARNDPEGAACYLQRATAVDPLRESAQRALMRALAAGGNYAAALVVYRELRLRLHREINAPPDPETEALFQRLRAAARQRVRERAATARERRPRAARSTTAGEAAGRRPYPRATGAPGATAAAELPLFALRQALAGGPLVGRAAELDALQRQIEAAAQGGGGMVFLAGEPGIGKTRLAAEASAWARQRGFRVLTGRCAEQGAAPYQPLAEALREYLETAGRGELAQALPPLVAGELVRIVPLIANLVKDLPHGPALSAEPARQALTEALRQFFALVTSQAAPVLLVLEDLHWADEGSLTLLPTLARQASNLRLLIVGTYRDLPPDLQHPLERTVSALHRERLAHQLPLRRLPEAGVVELVAAVLPDAPTAAFVTVLYRETEGNPFFIEEVLQHLAEEGALYPKDGRWQIQPPQEISLTGSVKLTIGRRLERLSESSRETLTLAAVIGQQFCFEVLLAASGLEEERLIEIVEEWLGSHLVVEQRVGRDELFRFQHALIREVLYEGVSRRRKARLHERVGLALEEVYGGGLEEHLDELAHHFTQARPWLPARAGSVEKGVDYCLRAGEKAQSLWANEDAVRYLTAALELLEGLPADEAHLRKRWGVVDLLWRAHAGRREHEQAQEVVREYLALAHRAADPRSGWWLRGC